jgi:hypothetical protein
MAMDGGSWQGARREAGGPALGDRGDRHAVEIQGARRGRGRLLGDARPGRPEHQLAQVVRAPDAAVAGGRDRRHGDPDEHHRQRYTPKPSTRVSPAR